MKYALIFYDPWLPCHLNVCKDFPHDILATPFSTIFRLRFSGFYFLDDHVKLTLKAKVQCILRWWDGGHGVWGFQWGGMVGKTDGFYLWHESIMQVKSE